MKRNYLSPAIETTEILVEQGIAQSEVILQDGFGLGDNTKYDEDDFVW